MSKRNLLMIAVIVVVLASGLVVALSDAGLPLPAAVVAVAAVIFTLAIGAAGIAGHRRSRADGGGFWRSVGRGMRAALRSLFELA